MQALYSTLIRSARNLPRNQVSTFAQCCVSFHTALHKSHPAVGFVLIPPTAVGGLLQFLSKKNIPPIRFNPTHGSGWIVQISLERNRTIHQLPLVVFQAP